MRSSGGILKGNSGNRLRGHDRCREACVVFFIHTSVDDLHSLQIFLHELLADNFDILFRLSAGSFPDAIGCMLFDQHPDLFRQIRPGSEFRHSLANQFALGEVALALANQNARSSMVSYFIGGSRSRR